MNDLQLAQQILSFKNTPFDKQKAEALDFVTKSLYGRQPSISLVANKIWEDLKNDSEFWTQVDSVFQLCKMKETHFLALKVLEEQIKTKWGIINLQSRETIKQFVIQLMMSLATNPSSEEALTNQINMTLIQILKYEWNTTWRNFIPELCQSSQSDQNLCENNIKVLRLLSQEVFDFSKNQMTTTQIKELKGTLTNEFQQIYQLCYKIMIAFIQNQSQVKPSLIKNTLECLYTYLSWIPVGYIFMTELIEILIALIDQQPLRVLAIRCLTEVASLKLEVGEIDLPRKQQTKLFQMIEQSLLKIKAFFPCDYGFTAERQRIRQEQQTQLFAFDEFCQVLTLYFTTFLSTHLPWLEPLVVGQQQNIQVLQYCFQYVVCFTELPLDTNYKVCAEFWHEFTSRLLERPSDTNINQGTLLLNLYGPPQEMTLKNTVYPKVLLDIRKIIVSHMAKPQEVLIVVDEGGMPCREEMTNTENNSMYELLRELLINLAKLSWTSTKDIIVQKLDKQMDGSEWSYDNLNSICWAVGSISGCLPDSDEKSFLIHTIRTLLNLCEQKKGKENKAIVASNIMYVVGQYPKFLKTNWNFLKTVVKKLFEFMKETFEGVQEMSCNTFLKIAQTCGKEFVINQKNNDTINDHEPYIYELIRCLPDETSPLDDINRLKFYEALGHIIRSESNYNRRETLLNGLLKSLLDRFNEISAQAQQNLQIIQDDQTVQWFLLFLKINQRVAYSGGFAYLSILQQISVYLTRYYIFYSQQIKQMATTQGRHVLIWHSVKKVRLIKKEILKLFNIFLANMELETPQNGINVYTICAQPLSEILADYVHQGQDLREAEVLQLFSVVFERLAPQMLEQIPHIIKQIFDSTIAMISMDFNSFPDHRQYFFEFIKTTVTHAFETLFNMQADQFKLMIDCIIWAFRHQLPALQELGLDVLIFIMKNVNMNLDIANQFYQVYYMRLLQDIIDTLTDSFHKSCFKSQTIALQILIQVSLVPQINIKFAQDQVTTNQEYVYNFLVNLLSKAFENVTPQQTAHHIQKMFQNANNPQQFKIELRDYLINLSQFSTDNEHLYTDEKQTQQQVSQQQ